MLPDDRSRAHQFFASVLDEIGHGRNRDAVVVVTHALCDRGPFLDALSKVADVAVVLIKPHSVDEVARISLSQNYPLEVADRAALAVGPRAIRLLGERVGDRPFAVLDMGGYFAPAAREVAEHFGSNCLGFIEDTENGQRRYERILSLAPPVLSVARSPLKAPEDHVVGHSIIFSIERLIRECGQVIQGRTATVIGYGKVGRSTASALAARSVDVRIVETDPVRAVEARAHGFQILAKHAALEESDLVVCATGNGSLEGGDFDRIKPGAFLASVTSSDDEINVAGLRNSYSSRPILDHVEMMSRPGHSFFLLNEGNAVNFIDGAVVGQFVQLVQAELIALTIRIRDYGSGVHGSPAELQRRIAHIWLQTYRERD